MAEKGADEETGELLEAKKDEVPKAKKEEVLKVKKGELHKGKGKKEEPSSKLKPRGRTRNSSQSMSEGEGGSELIMNSSQLQVGVRLEAMDKYGKWYVAKVVELMVEEEEEVLVHFERWSSRYDEVVPIKSGRLRQLTLERLKELEKDKEKVKKELTAGDRVQAKWVDGRLYYGEVVKVHGGEVDLLFDDGVQYTAPVTQVRKRSHKTIEQTEESYNQQAAMERRQRADKRKRKDKDAPTSSLSTSPLSSPLSVPPPAKKVFHYFQESLGAEHNPESKLQESGEKVLCGESSELSTPKRSDASGVGDVLRPRYFSQALQGVRWVKPGEEAAPLSTVPPEEGLAAAAALQGANSNPRPVPEEGPMENEARLQASSFLPASPVEPGGGGDQPATSQEPDQTLKDTQQQQQQQQHPTSQKATPLLPGPGPTRSRKGAGRGQLAKRFSKDTVATRTRAHTKPATVNTGSRRGRKPRKGGLPSKALVIEEDHNEFKCKKAGCTKSFRKLSLLESHIKHYHSPPLPPKPRASFKGKAGGHSSKASPSKSPRSPSSGSVHAECPNAGSIGKSPETAKDSRATTTTTGAAVLSPTARTQREAVTPSSAADEAAIEGVVRVQQQKAAKRQQQEQREKSDKSKTRSPGKVQGGPGHSIPARQLMKQELRVDIIRKGIGSDVVMGGVKLAASSSKEEQLSSKKQPLQTPGEKDTRVKGKSGMRHHSTSSFHSNNGEQLDVVHCPCGSDVDEGFMIQCEQCLCWQHGDCIGIRSNLLPKKYICYICNNPPGQRARLKYKFSRDWYGDGTLPSVPGGPSFPAAHSKAVLLTHQVADSLYKVKKMVHSSEVKLQAASNVNHPYLKQWAKECNHFSGDDILAYVMNQLLPICHQQQPSREQDGNGDGEDGGSNPPGTSQEDSAGTAERSQEVSVKEEPKEEKEEVCEEERSSADARPPSSDSAAVVVSKDREKREESVNQENQGTVGKKNSEDEAKEPTAHKRELRSSTLIQKNAVYYTPKKTRKTRASSGPSSSSGEESANGGSPVVKAGGGEAMTTSSPPAVPPVQSQCQKDGNKDNRSEQAVPLLVSSYSHLTPTILAHSHSTPTILTHSHSTPTILTHSYSTPPTLQSHIVTPEVAMGTSETEMEIITIPADEFGVSEVPVFAVQQQPPRLSYNIGAAAPTLPQPVVAISLPQQNTAATAAAPLPPVLAVLPQQLQSPLLQHVPAPTMVVASLPQQQQNTPVAQQLPLPTLTQPQLLNVITSSSSFPSSSSSSSSSAPMPSTIPSPSPSSFSPSAQSAFKPVVLKSNHLHVNPTSTVNTAPVNSEPSTTKTVSSPISSNNNSNTTTATATTVAVAPTSTGVGAVTLGEFAEDFVQKDKTNWFRRMKLLDHIETVQDNVQAWLDMIDNSLAELPDDEEGLENLDKLLKEAHSAIDKLGAAKQEEQQQAIATS